MRVHTEKSGGKPRKKCLQTEKKRSGKRLILGASICHVIPKDWEEDGQRMSEGQRKILEKYTDDPLFSKLFAQGINF